MIKKFVAIMFVGLLISVPAVTYAQTSTVDDSKIEESLREQGLDKAPDEVKVEESELRGQAPSSGFVDENGKPLSDAEYAQYLKDNEGVFKKYPWILPVIVLVVAGGIVVLVKRNKTKTN